MPADKIWEDIVLQYCSILATCLILDCHAMDFSFSDLRIYVYILCKNGIYLELIHRESVKAFPNDKLPTLWTIQRWIKNILDGVFSFEKHLSPGRPRSDLTLSLKSEIATILPGLWSNMPLMGMQLAVASKLRI